MAAGSPSLLCALGRHRPRASVWWNEGFYFTRCRRCGCDLVRTTYSRWQVPKGARVVWRYSRPEAAAAPSFLDESPARTVPAPSRAALPARQEHELPIQEVLRHLDDGGGQRAPARQPAGRTYIPDFMADAAADTSWRTNRPQNWPPPPEPKPEAAARAPLPPPPAQTAFALRRVLLGAGLAAVLLLVILLAVQSGPADSASSARAAALPAAAADSAFVTATMSECRASPGFDGIPVTRLLRGDPVRILARQADWVGVLYGGTQCWMPADELAVGMPL